jgi:succinyl-diaminopimelate desuccinylase
VARVGSGPVRLIYHGHIDVVPGHPEQFTPRVEGGRLFGRGAYDMKAALAAMMLAVADLSTGLTGVQVELVVVPDEERSEPGENCTQMMVHEGLTADFVVCGEPTDMQVGVQAKGVLMLRIDVAGTARTAPRRGWGQCGPSCRRPLPEHRRSASRPSRPLFDRPSINLGRIQGRRGQQGAGHAGCVDLRYLPTQSPDEVLRQVSSVEPRASVEVLLSCAPRTSPDNPSSRPLLRAAGRYEPSTASVRRDGAFGRGRFPRRGRRLGRVGPGRRPPRPQRARRDREPAPLRRALTDFARWRPARHARDRGGIRVMPARTRRTAGALPAVPPAPRCVSSPSRCRIAVGLVAPCCRAATSTRRRLRRRRRTRLEARRPGRPPSRAAGKPANILLIGSDTRPQGDPGRSDSLILVRMDPTHDFISMLSFPRDLYVPIPGLGMDKINAAYSQGPAKTIETVRELTGEDVNGYVIVDFTGFAKLVDAVGGVYLDIDRRYYNKNIGTLATNFADIDLQPGYQRLDGADALSYVRYRHTDSDYDRIARQQQFLSELKRQTKRLQPHQHHQLPQDLRREHRDQHHQRAALSCRCSSSP